MGECGDFNPYSELPDRFEYVDLESVIGTSLISHRTLSRQNAPSRAKRLARKNDLFYQAVRPYQKNNYLFEKLDKNYVFSTGYIQIRPTIDSYYLLSYVQKETFIHDVLERCTGTSYPAINTTDLKKISIFIPKSLEEQTAIGNFFKQLDDTIALHQRELDKLKILKEAYLKSIFVDNSTLFCSKNAITWEQRKLGELVNFKNGMNMDKNQMGFGYPFVNLQDVFEKSIVNDQYLGLVNSSKLQQQEYNLLKGDILLVRSSVKVEGVGLTSLIIKDIYECTYSGFLIRLRFIEKVNDNFKIFLFSTPYIRTQILSNATSSANTNINQEALKEIKINLPSLEEQTAIGNFFKQLDDTIALHQKELAKYQQIKAACLEKMFIK